MANDDLSEDRLTKNEFAELIQHLSVQEILAIEYCISNDWNKLFVRKHVSTQVFFCNLCALETSSFKNLLAHIDGRKHKWQMERVNQLYHPDYTYPKNSKEVIESCAKTNEDSILNSTPNQPVVVGGCNKDKSQNIENNKTRTTITTINSEKTNSTDKISSVKVQNELRTSSEKDDIISVNKMEEECVTLCTLNKKESKNLQQGGQKQDVKSKVKVNVETLNLESNSKESKNDSTKTIEKRPLVDNDGKGDVTLKKRKLVVNPAAALSLKVGSMNSKEYKNGESSKKPQYQTDKIIIPTVHKNISHIDKDSPQSIMSTNSADPPKFSVKSYSSNPSDNDVHGILGVEYVIKILKNRSDVSPRYECGLCELVLDGFAMQRHLEGYNHRLKFCEKHFPTAIRQYRQYMQNVPEPEIFKVMAPVLAKLSVAIEQHHGRNLPYECYERDFSLNRHDILAKTFSCRHASEQYGPTFTHVVGAKEIDEYINNRHKYLPLPFSRAAIFDIKHASTVTKSNNRHQNFRSTDIETQPRERHRNAGLEKKSDGTTYKSYMSSALHDNNYPPSVIYNQTDNINTVQHVDDETYNLMVDDFLKGTLKGFAKKNILRDTRKRSLSPARDLSSANRKSLSPLRQNDIWQAYRHMVDQELNKLDECFKQYRKDPETHPAYSEEWQKFWKRRKDELVAAGIDHHKYNYQPEWVRFVKARIEELYGQEVENLKIKSRERLCLPLSNEHISDEKYHIQTPEIRSTNDILTTPCNTDPNVGLKSNLTFQSTINNVPQVVSVLRLMTALEDSLGSLGPKIIDLLSKALQTEKTNPLHVNTIILNDENCSLIETAKEKFKGLVITGLFEGSKKKVLTQVVNDAEELLQYAYQSKKQLTSHRYAIVSTTNRSQNNSSLSSDFGSTNVSNALKNQSVGSNPLLKNAQSSSSITDNQLTRVDKKELASKLAASLVAQGKTDFDPQQLQQLIAVYKLIEKKKRDNAGTVLSNKGSSSSKKTLSDTLSDLLKSSSTSASDILKISNATQSVALSSNQKSIGSKFSSNIPGVYANSIPSSSFTSVLQNPSDNYFNNAAHSMTNSFGATGGGGNHFEQRSNYGMNYRNNLLPSQQNSNMSNVYNQLQYNNRMPQNWGWNSNADQNYNVGRPNNNFNQTSNWQNF